jgi:ectoine hydroxylase-related dioxygenase (phytanoyl-CoA dioxygenase family)
MQLGVLYEQKWETIGVPPACGTFTGPYPDDVVSAARFFDLEGFVILRAVINRSALDELDHDLVRITKNAQSLDPVREGFNVEDPSRWPSPEQPVFRKIGGVCDLSSVFWRLCRAGRILDVVQTVLRDSIHLYRDVVMMKQARVGREKPWHQDGVYWPYRPFRFASALIALDSMTTDNGCLQIVPRSHRDGPLPHHGEELRVTLSPEQQASTVYVPLPPGDVLIFDGLMLHASETNQSARHRRAAILSYMAASVEYMGSPPEPPRIPVRELAIEAG